MIAGAVLLAALGWAFTFGCPWGNFWIKIGLSVVLVVLYSLAWQRPRLRFSPASVLMGAASAVVLYGIFRAGDALAPFVVPGAAAHVGGIYGLGEGSPRVWIALLLLFVTGPGEEIFWRGFLQDRLAARLGAWRGYGLATAIYAAVHVFSLNPMLILAALVAGAYWGLFYLWKRDLAALIVSHSLWSAVIFTVAPIG